MKKIIILSPIYFLLSGCLHREIYTEKSRYMENTIRQGEKFSITKRKDIDRNDIVVYELFGGEDSRKFQFSGRIVGLPGDNVLIKNGLVYINNNIFPLPSSATFHYSVVLKYFTDEIKKDMRIEGQDLNDSYDSFLSIEDSAVYHKKYVGTIISMKKTKLNEYNKKMLLNGKNLFGWDHDNFGPVRIPVKKELLNSDSATFFLNKLEAGGIIEDKYLVTRNYYFVICDNFHNGSDSRDIGLINDNQIIGTIKIR